MSWSSSWFPNELVIDILKRVDDGSCIVRLRCLSKLWCQILSHPNFIHSFLSFDNRMDSCRQIIVMRTRLHRFRWQTMVYLDRPYEVLHGAFFKYNFDYTPKDDDDINARGMTYSLLSYNIIGEQNVLDENGLNPPPPEVVVNINPNNSIIVGSCDGILCIGSRKNGRVAASCLILWNPTTGEAKQLPSIPSIPSRPPPPHDRFLQLPRFPTVDEYLSFGFDSKTSDYKIVVILTLRSYRQFSVDGNGYHDQFSHSSKFPLICTWVYSMRDDKWRELRISSKMALENSPLPFFAGNYKLLVNRNSNITSWFHSCHMCKKCYIMNFNMSKQTFKLETFGMYHDRVARFLDTDPLAMGLVLKSNSILAIYNMFDWKFVDNFFQYYELWGILDYKKLVNRDSSLSASSGNWIKLFSFEGYLMRPLVSSDTFSYMTSLPGIWKDGYYFSMGENGELNLFNPETQQLKPLQVGHGDKDWRIFGIVAYTPSTISLSGFKRDGISFLDCFNF
ncbi:unnamed protein product [Linum trigynum]|uniref:F-box domain-containing protein n=1 Tax=Linum trigynum TaxID=586398 RepID=A0AAV2DA67_9ROSI